MKQHDQYTYVGSRLKIPPSSIANSSKDVLSVCNSGLSCDITGQLCVEECVYGAKNEASQLWGILPNAV